jgi:hypothetical protein
MKKIKINKWNYRVFKTIKSNNLEEYGIVEVYYDNKDKPIGYTDYEIPWGESLKDLKWQLSSMLKSCRQEILTEEDFKPRKKNGRKKVEK